MRPFRAGPPGDGLDRHRLRPRAAPGHRTPHRDRRGSRPCPRLEPHPRHRDAPEDRRLRARGRARLRDLGLRRRQPPALRGERGSGERGRPRLPESGRPHEDRDADRRPCRQQRRGQQGRGGRGPSRPRSRRTRGPWPSTGPPPCSPSPRCPSGSAPSTDRPPRCGPPACGSSGRARRWPRTWSPSTSPIVAGPRWRSASATDPTKRMRPSRTATAAASGVHPSASLQGASAAEFPPAPGSPQSRV